MMIFFFFFYFLDFPGSPVVKTSPFNEGGMGLIPGQGAKSHMPWGQKIWSKSNIKTNSKDFKMVHIKKVFKIFLFSEVYTGETEVNHQLDLLNLEPTSLIEFLLIATTKLVCPPSGM